MLYAWIRAECGKKAREKFTQPMTYSVERERERSYSKKVVYKHKCRRVVGIGNLANAVSVVLKRHALRARLWKKGQNYIGNLTIFAARISPLFILFVKTGRQSFITCISIKPFGQCFRIMQLQWQFYAVCFVCVQQILKVLSSCAWTLHLQIWPQFSIQYSATE
jgi:hypothetical protein